MHINNVKLNILIKGRAAHEYRSPLDFQTYIEGRDGSEFEVEIVNDNAFDIEAIVSIDGLSILDGKPAGTNSSGYLVPQRSKLVVPGWKVDGTTAAKFQFSGAQGGSYVEQIGGDALNKGVIGLKAFAPKVMPYVSRGLNEAFTKSAFRGATPRGMSIQASSYSSASSSFTTASINSSSVQLNNAIGSNAITPDLDLQAQTLGTEFGEATEFKTTQVEFTRGDLQAMMELFYDDRQGLKRRGIDVPAKTRPSAFPADDVGCAVPPGWHR